MIRRYKEEIHSNVIIQNFDTPEKKYIKKKKRALVCLLFFTRCGRASYVWGIYRSCSPTGDLFPVERESSISYFIRTATHIFHHSQQRDNDITCTLVHSVRLLLPDLSIQFSFVTKLYLSTKVRKTSFGLFLFAISGFNLSSPFISTVSLSPYLKTTSIGIFKLPK